MTKHSLTLRIYFEDEFTDPEKIVNFIKENVTGINDVQIWERV
jgi:hypothetical protein